MDRQPRFLYFVAGCALIYAALFVGAGMLLLSGTDSPDIRSRIVFALEVAAFITALLLAVIFLASYFLVYGPLRTLSREIGIITGVNPGYMITLPRLNLLGDIPKAVSGMGGALMKARREVAEAAAACSGNLEDSRDRLETILMTLKEGVIVCDVRGRIVFYNPAAKRVFHDSAALGLGRSLYQLCPVQPIESSLAVLRQRRIRDKGGGDGEDDIHFVSSTLVGAIISCSVRLLPEAPGLSWSFLLVCRDISRETDLRARRENLLRSAIRGMQTPLTSLSLTVDSLDMLPDMDPQSRAALGRAMVDDTQRLNEQFRILDREIGEMESARYPVSDVFTGDVIVCVAGMLETKGIRLTMTGDPLWIRADIQAVLFLLEFLTLKIHEFSGRPAIEIETLLGDKKVYFNFYWNGLAVPESEIAGWKSSVIDPSGMQTVAEVLSRHGSEVWSMPHDTPGYAVLRVPMPSSTRQWEPVMPVLPSRPVYADFSAPADIPDSFRMKDIPLNRATFVVFDTETTGLSPSEGDEIVSIAGVKIVNLGIVVGETFDQLVNPGRNIPLSSSRFHGITDGMVGGRPAIEEVLRSFHDFVGDAVLVGHNAAFDMRFIRIKEGGAGVRFAGPVLDTLSLSLFLHDHTPEHSLDAVASRLGVEVKARHTAMGDSLITAQIFIKFLYLLQERGIRTVGGLAEVMRR